MKRSTSVLALVALAAGVGCAADTRASRETTARDAFDPRLVPTLVRETALAGDFDGAAAIARSYAASMKDAFVPVAWDALGDVEAMRGDRDAAVAAYRRAEESNPHCCGDGQAAAGSAASKRRALTRAFAYLVAGATWREGTDAASLAAALGPRGGVVLREALPFPQGPLDGWRVVADVARRVPAVVVFDDSASMKTTERDGRTELFDTARRVADARRVLGGGVPFVGVDPMRGVGMPETSVVVDASGRVVFASEDVRLVGDVAELLLRR